MLSRRNVLTSLLSVDNPQWKLDSITWVCYDLSIQYEKSKLKALNVDINSYICVFNQIIGLANYIYAQNEKSNMEIDAREKYTFNDIFHHWKHKNARNSLNI